MFKNPETGNWEHDFRVDGLPRYRAIYGPNKPKAEVLHATAVEVFKVKDPALVHGLKDGRATLVRYKEFRDRGRPFSEALEASLNREPWPALGEAVETYVSALEANENRSAGTARAAGTQLQQSLAYFGPETRIDTITSAMVEQYQATLFAEGYAQNTVVMYVWRLGSLYQWFIRREARAARDNNRAPRVLWVPIDPETIVKEKTRRERFLSEAEAERLLAATPRALLFPVAAGLFGGFRVDEMIHFRPAFDVDLDLGTLAVQRQPNWQPKTKRSHRHVPIAGVLRPILEAHLAERSSEEWVTPSFRNPAKPLNRHTFDTHFGRIVEDAELVAGIEDPMGVTYHTLRHTFASWLLMKGTDLYTVAQLLGNRPQQVETTYGHLSRDHRKAAVDRLTLVLKQPTAEAEKSATASATLDAE
jgi:integrase